MVEEDRFERLSLGRVLLSEEERDDALASLIMGCSGQRKAVLAQNARREWECRPLAGSVPVPDHTAFWFGLSIGME